MANTPGCTPQESSRQQSPQQSLSAPSPQKNPANQNPALASLHINMGNSRAQLYGKYNSRMSRILGKTQIIGGALAFVMNAVGLGLAIAGYLGRPQDRDEDYGRISYYYDATWCYFIGTGLWCAAFTILSGSFALWAAKKRTKCVVITHMVLAIWAALMALTMLGVAVGAVGQDGMRLYEGFQYLWYPNWRRDYFDHFDQTAVPHFVDHYSERIAQVSMVVSVLFVLVAVSQVIASIWSSTLSCRVVCTDGTTSWDKSESVQFLANNSGQPQLLVMDCRGRQIKDAQVIQIMPGSGMMLQGQVVPAASSPLLQEPATQPDPTTTPQPKMDSDNTLKP